MSRVRRHSDVWFGATTALLAVWLAGWTVLSWGAIQDDALIHLRYAEFLRRAHFITYDGVHATYGTSSLLYVGLLAGLRGFVVSSLLSRAVSTFFHWLLFVTIAAGCWRWLRQAPRTQQWLALTLLLLLVSPSAVRWLDDGMETGMVLLLVGIVSWWTQALSGRREQTRTEYGVSVALGMLLVYLRTELMIVAGCCCVILCLADAGVFDGGWWQRCLRAAPGRSGMLAGVVAGALSIRVTMHSFLPDTALAKSHGVGQFGGSLHAAATVLSGALLFGLGMMALWLLSAGMALRTGAVRRMATVAANLLFPAVLLASAVRGQEIQGARYLVWTYFFSICWNLLELRRAMPNAEGRASVLAPALLVVCLVALPFESRLMYRVLTMRAHTMAEFRGEDLATPLHAQLGVAADVGYIGYFSQAGICDLAGLVNGREAAAMTPEQRMQRCAALHPTFAFVNAGQAAGLSQYVDMAGWEVCGQYDFGNVRDPDRHYLMVSSELTSATCGATGERPAKPAF